MIRMPDSSLIQFMIKQTPHWMFTIALVLLATGELVNGIVMAVLTFVYCTIIIVVSKIELVLERRLRYSEPQKFVRVLAYLAVGHLTNSEKGRIVQALEVDKEEFVKELIRIVQRRDTDFGSSACDGDTSKCTGDSER